METARRPCTSSGSLQRQPPIAPPAVKALRRSAVLAAGLGLALLSPSASAATVNWWPAFVGEPAEEEAGFRRWQGAGPLLFGQPAGPERATGLRPLYGRFVNREDSQRQRWHVLYPVFNYRQTAQASELNVFNLLTLRRVEAPEERADQAATTQLDVFPFIFYRSSPDPERSYAGLFPLYGSAQAKFWQDEIEWALFPLYTRYEKGGVRTTATPWPFIKFIGGEASGFHLWPLFGWSEREERYRRGFVLWPFGLYSQSGLWKEEPDEFFGALPFYTRSSSATAFSETFVWPFFGYTRSSQPEYFQTRYFWPLLVQTRGERYVNRWAPVYTRSIVSGVDKRWVMWPVFRQQTWDERQVQQTRTQLLYFLYWDLQQRSLTNPDAAPAMRRHAWPFFSYWDNGAGQRQFQTLSPFEVLFQYNDTVRALWSPLFAVYQWERRGPEETRHRALWSAVSYDRSGSDYDFQLGPLVRSAREDGRHAISVGRGLFGFQRRDDGLDVKLLWAPLYRSRHEALLPE
jgi:hypothetical protein